MSADVSVARAAVTDTRRRGTNATRWAALCGVLFAVTLIGNIVLTSSSPSTGKSATLIQHYYLTHQGRTNVASMFTVVAVASGLGFFLYLRSYYRELVGNEWLPNLFFTGALVFGIGGVISAGVGFTIGDNPKVLSAEVIQALHMMSQDLNVASLCSGLALLYLAMGLVIRRTGIAPSWLGWACWLMSVLSVTFFLAFIAFIIVPVWVLVVSVRMARSNPAIA